MPTLEGKLDPFIDLVFILAFQQLTFFVIEIIAGPVLLPSSIGQQQVEGYPGRENSPKAVFRTASKESERKNIFQRRWRRLKVLIEMMFLAQAAMKLQSSTMPLENKSCHKNETPRP